MGSKNFITEQHLSTKRNYIERMKNDKINCMIVAKKYEYDYWDGDRKFGYGGYKYLPGLWTPVAKKIIKQYKLSNNSNIIDLGCGKAFLIYEIKKILPNIKITGVDISKHGIDNCPDEIKQNISQLDARNKLPYVDNEFDLLLSFGLLHNFRIHELKKCINEINRISRKSYIMVESYRNEKELFNLQCWALTAQSFFDKEEWLWIYKHFNYNGDYEFIYFE